MVTINWGQRFNQSLPVDGGNWDYVRLRSCNSTVLRLNPAISAAVAASIPSIPGFTTPAQPWPKGHNARLCLQDEGKL